MYALPIRIKRLRVEAGLTQTQIAEKLGMTYQEYQKIENGKTVIRADKLHRICKELNVSADWLLGLDEKEGATIEIAEGIVKPKQFDAIKIKGRISRSPLKK